MDLLARQQEGALGADPGPDEPGIRAAGLRQHDRSVDEPGIRVLELTGFGAFSFGGSVLPVTADIASDAAPGTRC